MYFGDVWDWNFFWAIFKNILSSAAPFMEIVIAVIAVGLVLVAIVRAIKGMGKS